MGRHEKEQESYPESLGDFVMEAVSSARSRGKSTFDLTDIALALSKNPYMEILYQSEGIDVRDLQAVISERFPVRTKGRGIFRRPDPFLGMIEASPEAYAAVKICKMDDGSITNLFYGLIGKGKTIEPIFNAAKEMGQARRRK